MAVSFKRRTKADWLLPSADLTELIRRLRWASGSWAAVGAVATFSDNPDTGGAPAAWNPATRELLVNASVACPGQSPEDVRIGSSRWRRRNRRAMGMIVHEAGHAAFTPDALLGLWNDVREVSPAAQALLQVCEETRMERLVLAASDWQYQSDLRACARDVILRDMPTGQGAFQDSLGVVLTMGRSRDWSGALEEKDLRKIAKVYSDAGLPVASLLSLAWEEYSGMDAIERQWIDNRYRVERAMNFFRAWCDLLDITPEDADESSGGGGGGEGEESETSSAAAGAMEEAMEEASSGMAEADAAEEADEEVRDAESVKECHGQRTNLADYPASELPERTPVVPDIADRRLAGVLTKSFQRIATPDIRRTNVRADLPPGRWNSRAGVQREAELAASGIGTSKDWNQRRKSSVRVPPPVIGVMIDVSGSMSAASAPMASLLWSLGESARAIQARFYGAYMGNVGVPYDHEPRRKINAPATGGREAFGDAFAIVDERLHFSTRQRCARLLLIVSDGQYSGRELGRARSVTRHLDRLGVTVIWCVPPGCRIPVGMAGRVHLGVVPRELCAVIAQEIKRSERTR